MAASFSIRLMSFDELIWVAGGYSGGQGYAPAPAYGGFPGQGLSCLCDGYCVLTLRKAVLMVVMVVLNKDIRVVDIQGTSSSLEVVMVTKPGP